MTFRIKDDDEKAFETFAAYSTKRVRKFDFHSGNVIPNDEDHVLNE